MARWLLVLQVVASCLFFQASVSGAELDEILRVWKDRQDAAIVVQYVWTETRTERTDGLLQDSIFSPAFVERRTFEEETVTHVQERALELAPKHIWHEKSGVEWNVDTGQFLDRTYTFYHDATVTQIVHRIPDRTAVLPELAPAVAFLRVGEYRGKMNYAVGPVVLHHRTLDAEYSPVRRASLELTSEQSVIAENRCVMLQDRTLKYWVDVDNDFLIRRYEMPSRQPGTPPRFRVEMKHEREPSDAWMLTGWSLEVNRGNQQSLDTLAVAKVTRATLNARPYSKEMLTKLPVGTDVQDRRGQSSTRYMLLEDRRRREITDEDQKYGSPTYEEYVHSGPGKAMPERFKAISERVKPIETADSQARGEMLDELRDYLTTHRTLQRHVELARRTASRLFRSAEPEAAVQMCQDFAGISEVYRRTLLPMSEQLEGDLRRERLLGNTIQLTGTIVDGDRFDWESYRGKVVLVDFWYTGCVPCLEQMPQILELYERHREAGFDVVGVSMDANRDDLTDYLTKAKIPWKTIHEPWDSPNSNVSRYNITAFPTSILVDRNGKVLSIEANAERLEKLLDEHLSSD